MKSTARHLLINIAWRSSPTLLALATTIATPTSSPAAATAHATSAPQGREAYCTIAADTKNFRRLADDPANHMDFRNKGGLFNGGVCWWHSLFQRAAWYLTVYRPDRPKPNLTQAKFLVHLIARGKDVVEIPGYSNFREFSRAHRDLIQDKLEQWQVTDGLLKFVWINGLLAPGSMPPDELRQHMRSFTELVNRSGEIHWAMWQVPGITAHASLFLFAHPTSIGSLSTIVDSNFPGRTDLLPYIDGSSEIQTYFGPMVPYPGRSKDLKRFAHARSKYCDQGPSQWSQQERERILEEPLDNGWD